MRQHPDLLVDCQMADSQVWGNWANSPAPEASFPPPAGPKLAAFQRLVLVQVSQERLAMELAHVCAARCQRQLPLPGPAMEAKCQTWQCPE